MLSCSLLRPWPAKLENCQLRTSDSWLHVARGGFPKNARFCYAKRILKTTLCNSAALGGGKNCKWKSLNRRRMFFAILQLSKSWTVGSPWAHQSEGCTTWLTPSRRAAGSRWKWPPAAGSRSGENRKGAHQFNSGWISKDVATLVHT